jgi:hypothetical protein
MRAVCVADTRDEVCYWIGEVHSFPFIPRSLRLGKTSAQNLREWLWQTLLFLPKLFSEHMPRFQVLPELPAGLDDARNFALERKTAEAQTADTELAQKRARTAAELAAVVLAGLELRFASVFDALCSGCHVLSLLLRCCFVF